MGIHFSSFHLFKLEGKLLSQISSWRQRCFLKHHVSSWLLPTNLASSHGGSSNLFRKQKLLNSGFFWGQSHIIHCIGWSWFALRGCAAPVCSLSPHGSPSNMWRWWSWTSDLWAVFQLKYSLSVTVNPPTHSPLPFSAPIIQTFFSACRSFTVPPASLMGCLSRSRALLSVHSKMPSLVGTIYNCTTIFYVSLRNKQKPLPIKLWHDINYKAHFIFRYVKMWK